MTASSGGASGSNGGGKTRTPAAAPCNIAQQPPTSSVFQQIKQTQASLARLTRVQQQLLSSQSNQPSQQQNASASTSKTTSPPKSTTFVDCLIRRFKDCFSEDFCTVPMFVVGNLSPGSDGTHLILPPCVSLGRQNINRFASPKNLRLINSIRESCKSIEELDLGGNKFNDLIEVYKILQCTPNLKFLNLSENDLSRTSPVAMASNSCLSTTNSNGPTFQQHSSSVLNNITTTTFTINQQQQQQHLSASSMALNNNNSRAYLAPINQNNSQQQVSSTIIGVSRRHSTLGQQSSSPLTSGSGNNTTTTSIRKSTEARRLAATAALAQSKKTSSLVASKLTNSAAADRCSSKTLMMARSSTSSLSCRPSEAQPGSALGNSASNSLLLNNNGADSSSKKASQKPTSTMHLARSLSSLSSKDIRAATSSAARLTSAAHHHHQRITRHHLHQKETAHHQLRRSTTSLGTGGAANLFPTSRSSGSISSKQRHCLLQTGSKNIATSIHNKQKKLFDEPIVETDNDVDMSDNTNQQQVSLPGVVGGSGGGGGGNHHNQHQQQVINNINNVRTTALTTNTNQQSTGNNFRRTFNSIKALALNNTGCQWKVVCSILNRMPNLEELHLSLNNYERIDLDPIEFKHYSLKRLYLCNNPKLTNWQELDKLLLAFPSLEALSIADCNISQIPDNLDRAREWRKLCGLNINGWPIKDWSVIERLNQLPSLSDLKCRNLDILNSIDEPRHHLIARLPKLQKLNGSEIEEREHAEKAFLRFFMANSHLERPTRFHELVQIHGEIIPVDVDVDLSPPSRASVKVIYLNRNHYKKENEDDVIMSEDFLIKLMDNADQQQQQPAKTTIDSKQVVRLFKDEGQEVLGLQVDLRQSVKKFKSTLAQLFRLNNQNLILYYIDHEMVGLMGPELIKHNQKKLWNYNVQDGDQFIVEER